MGDLFVVSMGRGDDEERSHQEAERLRLRDRYLRYLVETARIDAPAAERVMVALFDHLDAEGRTCPCGCHPRLASLHGDGFDCPCTWDDMRRGQERRRSVALWDSAEAASLRDEHAAQERSIEEWLVGQRGVEARRTTPYVPEQWEGTVDGHSFYFRERGGFWRLELDSNRPAVSRTDW